MLRNIFQIVIKWLPLILFFCFIFIDRNNYFQVTGFIILLLVYTSILIIRILYAKKDWHKEYNKDGQVENNQSINKLDDLKDNLN